MERLGNNVGIFGTEINLHMEEKNENSVSVVLIFIYKKAEGSWNPLIFPGGQEI